MTDGRHFDCRLIGRPLAALGTGDRPVLPGAVIEYVQLTRATLLLDDPANDPRFGHHPYLAQRQPKSVLCLPVHTQGKLVAVVYLENNLMESAFTPKHQQTLELLGAQAAISLVNARLYDSLERKVAERTEELRQMSMKDGLTGIANRRSFDERLAVELRRGLRSQAPLSLLMIDIDHFKQYNDHYGHFQGDDCIRAVAAALTGAVSRAGDLVARYGGEEFAILLPDTDPDAALQVAQACQDAVAGLAIPHDRSGVAAAITLSIGVGTITVGPDASEATLITRADQALYRAKRGGRNRICRCAADEAAAIEASPAST
jgi:diguanylate cyclase (GGDEF)-like protein